MFLLWLSLRSSLYILLIPYQIYDSQIFFLLSCGFAFLLFRLCLFVHRMLNFHEVKFVFFLLPVQCHEAFVLSFLLNFLVVLILLLDP